MYSGSYLSDVYLLMIFCNFSFLHLLQNVFEVTSGKQFKMLEKVINLSLNLLEEPALKSRVLGNDSQPLFLENDLALSVTIEIYAVAVKRLKEDGATLRKIERIDGFGGIDVKAILQHGRS